MGAARNDIDGSWPLIDAAASTWPSAHPPTTHASVLPVATPEFIAALGEALDSVESFRRWQDHAPVVADVDIAEPGSTPSEPAIDFGAIAPVAGDRLMNAAEPVDAAVTPASRRSLASGASAALWTTLGFVAGVAAWHFVGFWAFVSTVAFNGDDGDAAVRTTIAGTPVQTSDIVTGSIGPVAPDRKLSGCVAISIDPITGNVAHRPCPDPAPPLIEVGQRPRDDRAAPQAVRPRAESPKVEAPAPPSADALASALGDARLDFEMRDAPIVVTPPSADVPLATQAEPFR